MTGICDVCHRLKDVEWCTLCKANICEECRPKMIARLIAAAKDLKKKIPRIGVLR